MAEIIRVVVLGAGAMGAFFASRFADAPGFTTALVARGERHDRLRAGGLVVNGRPYALPVIHPDEASTPADLIIVALKHHQLPGAIDREFTGRIPDTVEELCRLPGVGRKTANLVVAVAFDKPAVCVDVHVHRISNRLGLVRTRTPLETEMALRKTLPVRYWKTWNRFLVSFGQTVCLPRKPKCAACAIRW